MSRIPSENASGLSVAESLLSEAGLFRGQPIPGEPFDSHLQRARTRPDEPVPTVRPDSTAGGATRPSAADTRPAATNDPEDDSRRPSDERATGDSAPPVPAEETPQGDRPESEATEADTDSSPRPETAEAGEKAEARENGEAREKTDAKDPETDADEASGETEVSLETNLVAGELPVDAENENAPAANENNENNENAEPSGTEPDVDERKREDRADFQVAQGKQATETTGQPEQTVSERPYRPVDPSRQAPASEAEGSGGEVAETNQVQAGTVSDGTDVTSEQGDSEAVQTGREGEPVDARVEHRDLAAAEADGRDQPIDQPQDDQSATAKRTGAKRHRGRAEQGPPTAVSSPDAPPKQPEQNATSQQVEAKEVQAVSHQQTVSAAVSTAESADATVKGQTPGSTNAEVHTATRPSAGAASRPEAPPNTRHVAEPGPVDRERFVQRVARAFETMGHRNGVVRLKLHPPELGSLRLEITVRHGVMTARVEAETQAARNMLLDNLSVLRERLAQQDIKIEQFNVDLTDRSPGGLPGQTADFAESHERGGNGRPAHADVEGDAEGENARDAGAIRRPGEGVQLNVVV